MGLDTTHNCYHGSYSSFGLWRKKISVVAGFGELDLRVGFGGHLPWPEKDPIEILLTHSDCDGKILAKDCAILADRLEQLLPSIANLDLPGEIFSDSFITKRFIHGLREAAQKGEDVEFM